MVHDELGHNGTHRTYILLKRLYYWKGLKPSVEKHIKRYISVNFSSCFYNVEGDFLLNKINFVGGDKLSPVFKHGFLRSEENVFPVFLYTQMCMGNVIIHNFLIFNVWLVVFPYL